MKPGERDITLRIGTKFDLTGVTAITLDVVRPDGSPFTVDNSRFTVGQTDALDDSGNVIFEANKYVTFNTVDGEFPDEGDYNGILTADFGANKRLKSVETVITVEA